ncbi:MAG: hypothetical protein IT198_02640 [Acidimicrobiia bacterium]|nr:hypothetical protein [Acidimicrobiia bacterium]
MSPPLPQVTPPYASPHVIPPNPFGPPGQGLTTGAAVPLGMAPPRNLFAAPAVPPPLLGGGLGSAALASGSVCVDDDGFASKAVTVVGRVLVALILAVAAGAGYILFRDANRVEIASDDMPSLQVPRPAPPIAPPAPGVPVSETPPAPVEEPPATSPPDLGEIPVQAAPPIEVAAPQLPPEPPPPPAPAPPPGAIEFMQGLDRATDAHNEVVVSLATTVADMKTILLPADPSVVAEVEGSLTELEAAIDSMAQYEFPAESGAEDIVTSLRRVHALLTRQLDLRTDARWPTLNLLTQFNGITDQHREKVRALSDELIPAYVAWVESQMYG